MNNKKIDIFNYGKHLRDFTFIDDVVNGIYLCATKGLSKFKKIILKYSILHLEDL